MMLQFCKRGDLVFYTRVDKTVLVVHKIIAMIVCSTLNHLKSSSLTELTLINSVTFVLGDLSVRCPF